MKMESFRAPWQKLGTVSVADLVEAKVQLHWAAQIVAAFGNALLEPKPDDSQSNLGWVNSLDALCSHESLEGLSVGLRFSDLTLLFLNPKNTIQAELQLSGQTLRQAFEWLTATYSKVSEAPPSRPFALRDYEMPSHPVGETATFQLGSGEPFREFQHWYATLTMSFTRYPATGRKPHPFDVGRIILISPP